MWTILPAESSISRFETVHQNIAYLSRWETYKTRGGGGFYETAVAPKRSRHAIDAQFSNSTLILEWYIDASTDERNHKQANAIVLPFMTCALNTSHKITRIFPPLRGRIRRFRSHGEFVNAFNAKQLTHWSVSGCERLRLFRLQVKPAFACRNDVYHRSSLCSHKRLCWELSD